MIHLVVGLYPIFYGLGAALTIRYIRQTLSLKEPSVGRYVGVQLLVHILGIVTGIVAGFYVTRVWSYTLFLACAFFIFLMMQNLLIVKDYAVVQSTKRIGVYEYNQAEAYVRSYQYSMGQVILGIVIAFTLGLLLPPVASLIGYALIYIGSLMYQRKALEIVNKAPDLTKDELIKKQEEFDKSEDLSDLDNQTYVKNLKQRVKKIYKKVNMFKQDDTSNPDDTSHLGGDR